MSDWNRPSDGSPPRYDPWQELPSYPYDTLPETPGPGPDAPPPQVPVEAVSGWARRAWQLQQPALGEYAVIQALVAIGCFISVGVLTGPLMAGYYRYVLRREQGGAADVNHLIDGFTASIRATFLPGLALAWGVMAASSVLAVLANLLLGQIPLIGILLQAAALLAGGLAIAAMTGLFSLMFPLILEQRLSAPEAYERCVALLRQDPVRATIFGAAVGVPFALGLAVLGAGVLVGGPLGMLIGAQGYRAIFERT